MLIVFVEGIARLGEGIRVALRSMLVMLMTPEAVSHWLSSSSLEDAVAMQKPAPDEGVVMRPPEKKAAYSNSPRYTLLAKLAGR